MKNLFGTDGIRGKAFDYPITSEMVSRVGYAVASVFGKNHQSSKILIGRDTRESGEILEKSLIAGICQQNRDNKRCKRSPTRQPADAFLRQPAADDDIQ